MSDNSVTKFENIVLNETGTIGELQTVTTLRVWRCKEKEWLPTPTILRNTLLHALHPFHVMTIGEIDKTDEDPYLLNPFTPSEDFPKQYLDLASGNRNHGRFTFNEQPIGYYYYGRKDDVQWKRIIYGSILHTGCKKLIYNLINYIVSDDENYVDGEQLDDPINDMNWNTGDSHGKMSAEMMRLLGLPNPQSNQASQNIPQQIRAALHYKHNQKSENGWVGKGTVSWNPLLENPYPQFTNNPQSPYIDFIIPHSSLKGNKPKLGTYKGKLLFGLVFEAERRMAKPGWMLFQWFSFDTLEKDGIISDMKKRLKEIRSARANIYQLVEVVKVKINEEAEEYDSEDNEEQMSEAEYEDVLTKVIQADIYGALLIHPYITYKLAKRTQGLWLNMAKSAGVRFYSVMTQPDESLAHYFVVQPDGRIVGRKVFCSRSFPQGKYIVFVNPMRHWGDVQIWENRHEGYYTESYGVMAAPKDLFLSVGRDFDGDFIQLIQAEKYPELTKAIESFEPSPIVDKLPKVPLSGNLQEIAIRSMNDLTGVVTSLLARAKSVGVEQHVLKIPPGGMQTSPKEMRIVDFLSQEIQIAVDSLKSAYPNNTNGHIAVKKYLDKIENSGAEWLKDFKNKDCYLKRPCKVNSGSTDTISRLVSLVNEYWDAPNIDVTSSARSWMYVIFNEANIPVSTDTPYHDEEESDKPTEFQLELAYQHKREWGQEMGEAIKWEEANFNDSSKIRQVTEKFKNLKDDIYNTPNPDTGELFSARSWNKAYWRVTHDSGEGSKASMVFFIFLDEICEELEGYEHRYPKKMLVYGCQWANYPWNKPGFYWMGETAIVYFDIDNSYYGNTVIKCYIKAPWIDDNFYYLGIVGHKYRSYVRPGLQSSFKILTSKVSAQKTNQVYLLRMDANDDKIEAFMKNTFWWRMDNKNNQLRNKYDFSKFL